MRMAVRKHRRRDVYVSLRKDETRTPKISDKIPLESKDKNKKAVVIAQEIKIARLLANNDKKVRDKVLKRLNKWLTVRSQSSFGKFDKLLHYYVDYIININIFERQYFYVFLEFDAWYIWVLYSVHESRLHEFMERSFLLYVDVG